MFRRVLKVLASLKLAVIIIAAIAVLIALGTVVESKYDAWTAKNLIYNSLWMYLALGGLATSLIAVMADRWPWQPRHIPFLLAHAGILIILYGSMLTYLYGIDGTVRLPQSGEVVKDITLQDTELVVFRSRTGEDYEKVFSEGVNFLKNPVNEEKPFLIKAKDLKFEILESIDYGLAQMKVESSPDSQSGAAVRFQLSNANVSEVDWLVQRNLFEKAEKQIGPVLVTLGGLWNRTPEVNEIRLFQDEKQNLRFALYAKEKTNPSREGMLKEGAAINTDWMGLKLQALRYFPKARQKYEVVPLEYPQPNSRPSLRVQYNGEQSYLVLNDFIKVFTPQWVYLVAYVNKRVPLGFDLSLTEFKKSQYPGTTRAMAYESSVRYDGNSTALISMNEPLKYNEFYLYQASFEDTPFGKAKASILSVNKDPGRPWKYFGSLIMTLGVIALFYFRRVRKKSST